MAVIPISDADDPRIAAYRDIRDRDRVGRDGLFVAEGNVVLGVLLGPASRFRAISALVAEKRLPAVLPLFAAAPDLPVFAATQPVMDRIAGFPIHRGILAIGEVGPALPVGTLLAGCGPRSIVVVALGTANHDNIGGIFRNAAAFGAAGVVLGSDACDPLYRKAIRVSVGTTLTVPFARLRREDDAVALLRDAGFAAIALSPSGTRELSEVEPGGRVALILGAEGPGLPESVLARAEAVRIAIAPGVDSLNVAVASGIALHHLAGRR